MRTIKTLYIFIAALSLLFSTWVLSSHFKRMVRHPDFFPVREVQMLGVNKDISHEILMEYDLNRARSLLDPELKVIEESMRKDPRISSVQMQRQFPATLSVKLALSDVHFLGLRDLDLFALNDFGAPVASNKKIYSWDHLILRKGGQSNAFGEWLEVLAALPEQEAKGIRNGFSEWYFEDEHFMVDLDGSALYKLGKVLLPETLRKAHFSRLYLLDKGLKAKEVDLRFEKVKIVYD